MSAMRKQMAVPITKTPAEALHEDCRANEDALRQNTLDLLDEKDRTITALREALAETREMLGWVGDLAVRLPANHDEVWLRSLDALTDSKPAADAAVAAIERRERARLLNAWDEYAHTQSALLADLLRYIRALLNEADDDPWQPKPGERVVWEE